MMTLMRKEIFRMSRGDAVALLERAPIVRIATTTERGEPVLRAMNAAIIDDRIAFHAARAGEKMDTIGREAIVSAEEIVASIPSYFVDPERACPATTLYRSVQIHGTLDRVDDDAFKARALTALLAKHQPEGGFVPLAHDHPLYARTIASLLVLSVSLERLDGKAKLGQNRTPPEQQRMVAALWKRGDAGDAEAAFAVLGANPTTPPPDVLRAPLNLRFDLGGGRSDAEACADLLDGTYWNDRFTRAEIVDAHLGSRAWLVARDGGGHIVASARAISDGVKYAWIYDVIVSPAWRGKRVGEAVVSLLVDHPVVRHARFVRLGTRDAMSFYARLGFVETAALPPRPYRSTDMLLAR